jgi:hypothetical protein
MAKQLDPRMIGDNLPIRTNSVISNTLTALSGDIFNLYSNNGTITNFTANNINTSTLSSTNTTISGLNVLGNVETNFFIESEITTSSYTFSDSDKSKVFHFNTTTTPIITAIFPSDISNGFNISIINTGIGVIYLSADLPFNATSQYNTIQHTGVLVYKYNNQYHGIGVLE